MLIVTRAPILELVGSLAVLFSFAHAQVADRLSEKEAQKEKPEVGCFKWARRYFIIKEQLWFIYFILKGAWAALAGCIVFLIYPVWRAWWRARQSKVRG